jgi:Protein of unknown function (DUF1553)/Protein of unknown function (DUF1549)
MKHCLPIVGFLLVLPSVVRANDPPAPPVLAKRIDELLAREHQANNVLPAAMADDAEFFRRASLDLTGRIPYVADVREFLADKDPAKRSKLITSLLENPRHARYFANVWRALLAPEITASPQAGVFKAGFESWLYKKFRSRAGYDKLVVELLAVPIASDPRTAEVVFSDFEKPNALAFYAVKDAKPENLAGAATRLFLGVQLECAQCHDHPFASWSREQFWNQAAFFAGIQREGSSLFAPLIEQDDKREVQLPSARKVPAIFLDGKTPTFQAKVSPRVALAEWITAADNPYFARAAVNRVWGLLFGTGIVDPVDNIHDANKPSHPLLLDELATAFVQSKFDLDYILIGICLTDAYQRSSARTHASQDNPRLFARMEPKALTGEQFFDSLALATGYQEPAPGKAKTKGKGKVAASPRNQFLTEFALRNPLNEPETSIQQALTLMNGKFVNDATSLGKNATLTAAVETPLLKISERIDILYLATLSRFPTPQEMQRLIDYVQSADQAREPERLADIFWILLNTAEFRLNH